MKASISHFHWFCRPFDSIVAETTARHAEACIEQFVESGISYKCNITVKRKWLGTQVDIDVRSTDEPDKESIDDVNAVVLQHSFLFDTLVKS